MDKRLLREIEHGRKIVNIAEKVWGWQTPAGKKRWERRVRMLSSHIKPGMLVLEIGCGTGLLTRELQNTKAKIISVDVSACLLEIARKNINTDDVCFLFQDASNLGIKDNSFDTVIGSSILHHLEINKAFKEFYRVLRNDGSIVFTEPNMMNPQMVIQKNIPLIKILSGDSPDEIAFLRWRLEKDLKKVGFRDIEIINFDFLHPAIPVRLINLIQHLGEILESLPILSEISGSLYIKAKK